MLLAACSMSAAVPVVTFHSKGATAKVTPGADTGWLCWRRSGTSSGQFLRAADSDGDGVVQANFGSTSGIINAGCAVVEIGSGDFTIANMNGAPGEYSPLPDHAIVRGTSGEATEIFLPQIGSSWLMMWVRPGGGVWGGSGPDHDRLYANDFSHHKTSDLSTPAGGSPLPSGFAQGDLFFVLRPSEGFRIEQVDRFLASNGPGVLRFAGNVGVAVTENAASTATVLLYRLGGSSGTVSVRARVTDPAVAPYDTLFTFAPGEVRKEVGPFVAVNDNVYSGTRNARIELYAPVGTSIDDSFSGSVSIHDDDPRPVLTLGSGLPASIDEPDAPLDLTVTMHLSAVASVPVEVQYFVTREPAAPGWSHVAELVTLAPGQTAATRTVRGLM